MPSQLFREMCSLPGSEISDNILKYKYIWINRLPSNTRLIISDETLDKVTLLAGKISKVSVTPHAPNVHAVETQYTTAHAQSSIDTKRKYKTSN